MLEKTLTRIVLHVTVTVIRLLNVCPGEQVSHLISFGKEPFRDWSMGVPSQSVLFFFAPLSFLFIQRLLVYTFPACFSTGFLLILMSNDSENIFSLVSQTGSGLSTLLNTRLVLLDFHSGEQSGFFLD